MEVCRIELLLGFDLFCAFTDNKSPHRWLFIIEGAGTIVAGFLAVWLLPDFPGSGKHSWLSDQEQRFAEWRLAQAANSEFDENGSVKEGLIDAFTDPKAWVLIGIQICQLTSQTWTYFFPVSTNPFRSKRAFCNKMKLICIHHHHSQSSKPSDSVTS
jgi:hypothetical protein